MMINRDKFKKSESFKNVEKDLAYIVSKIREDEELFGDIVSKLWYKGRFNVC